MANGMLKLTSHTYSGGAAPAPGMLLGRVEWKYNDSSVYLQRHYQPCYDLECGERETDPESNIAWEEIEGTRAIVFQEGGPMDYYHHTIYSVQIKLWSKIPGQTMTGIGQESMNAWFICDQRVTFYP